MCSKNREVYQYFNTMLMSLNTGVIKNCLCKLSNRLQFLYLINAILSYQALHIFHKLFYFHFMYFLEIENEDMIECSEHCNNRRWFHASCVNIDNVADYGGREWWCDYTNCHKNM